MKQPIKMVIVMVMHYFHSVLKHGLPPNLNLNHYTYSTLSRIHVRRESMARGTKEHFNFAELSECTITSNFSIENLLPPSPKEVKIQQVHMSKCKSFSCQHTAKSTSSATSSITRPEMRLAADSTSILHFSKDPVECLRSLVSDSTESKGTIALTDSPSVQLVPN